MRWQFLLFVPALAVVFPALATSGGDSLQVDFEVEQGSLDFWIERLDDAPNDVLDIQLELLSPDGHTTTRSMLHAVTSDNLTLLSAPLASTSFAVTATIHFAREDGEIVRRRDRAYFLCPDRCRQVDLAEYLVTIGLARQETDDTGRVVIILPPAFNGPVVSTPADLGVSP